MSTLVFLNSINKICFDQVITQTEIQCTPAVLEEVIKTFPQEVLDVGNMTSMMPMAGMVGLFSPGLPGGDGQGVPPPPMIAGQAKCVKVLAAAGRREPAKEAFCTNRECDQFHNIIDGTINAADDADYLISLPMLNDMTRELTDCGEKIWF